MEFLKDLFGTQALTFEQFSQKCGEKKLNLANLADGGYVSKEKYAALQTQVSELTGQLRTTQESLKAFDGVDVGELKGQIAKLQTDLQAQADGFAFDAALDGAIRDARGRDVKAIRGMLDLDALRGSKDRSADIKAALEGLAKEKEWAFEAAQETRPQPGAGLVVDTGGEHGAGGTATTDGVEAAFAALNPDLKA